MSAGLCLLPAALQLALSLHHAPFKISFSPLVNPNSLCHLPRQTRLTWVRRGSARSVWGVAFHLQSLNSPSSGSADIPREGAAVPAAGHAPRRAGAAHTEVSPSAMPDATSCRAPGAAACSCALPSLPTSFQGLHLKYCKNGQLWLCEEDLGSFTLESRWVQLACAKLGTAAWLLQ